MPNSTIIITAVTSKTCPSGAISAHRQNGPILELGCGTGRIFQPLAQEGLPMIGLDLDDEMLAHLHKNSSLAQPAVFQADMAAFRLARHSTLIILPCNTFSTLDSKSARRHAGLRRPSLERR